MKDILEILEDRKNKVINSGDKVEGISTAFPKNPPPPGINYSKNFARFQKDGIFSIQTKD